ncbi:helicase associated domain-containing protein, partial [Mycobacterium sp.]|uniref:helicase associated domain-containing protein n=1 Tax=Mycobacterium sp. TaxID=1785 RepID=UPI003F993AE9
VWDVIKALRSHDDRLGEQLDILRQQLAQGGKIRRPGPIILDLPVTVGSDFARAFDVRLVEQTTASWEFSFGVLEQFVEHNGHACVPKSYMVGRYRLGGWVQTQRGFHARGTLDADHERRLQDLPGWTWDPYADRWEEGFSRLQYYVEHNGDARVPKSYTVGGYLLGAWVHKQRGLHAKGTLDADRERRLQDLPGWTWDTLDDRWEEGFSRLLDYVEHNGDAHVPQSYRVDGYWLGNWVAIQRTLHAKGTLHADREHRLEDLPGWTWDPYADRWEEGFSRLLDYVEHHGDARVPRDYITADDYKLGGWAAEQRRCYAEGTLEADRADRLQKLTGWIWNLQADKWEEGFRRVLHYLEQNNGAYPPQSYKDADGYRVGAWINLQRDNHAKGILDAEREHRLKEDLPGWSWDPHADQWEGGFRRLLHYIEQNGHARVPAAYVADDGYRLGAWVATQRLKHTKGTLDTDRKHRLQELPGWKWKVRSSS